MNHDVSKDKIDINSQNIEGYTPLMVAIHKRNEETVSLLCQSSNASILDLKNKRSRNAIDEAVFIGNISSFSSLVLALFKRNNINNFEDLTESIIFSETNMSQWFEWCAEQKIQVLMHFY